MNEKTWIIPTLTDTPAAVSLASPAGAERLVEHIGTRRVSIAATTGAGKTFAAMRLLELLHAAGSPFVVIDPVGNFWGLRVGKDGKSPGLSVPVLGGSHGDLPLFPESGRKVSELLARRPCSLVLDISRFDDTERAGFITDLARRLLELWSEQRRVLTVVVDEAQDVIPETLERRADTPMRAAVKRIALTGRNLGLGLITLTLAPQLVLKRVFNLSDLLLVGRLGGHHERKAIEQWVRQKGVLSKEALEDLPTLSPGTFFAWSPEWLTFFGQVKVTARTTFDASRTPELGGARVQQGALAPVDLELLERELQSDSAPASKDETPEMSSNGLTERQHAEHDIELHQALERAERSQADSEHYRERLSYVRAVANDLALLVADLDQKLTLLHQSLDRPPPELPNRPYDNPIPRAPRAVSPAPDRPRRDSDPAQPTTGYVNDILAVICRYGPLHRARLSILSGKSKGSSTFVSAIRWLVTQGLITVEGSQLEATPLGLRKAPPAPLPTGKALYDHWMGLLKPYDQANFDAVFKSGRKGLTRSELSERTGHSKNSSTFSESIRRIITMGLCESRENRVRVVDHVREAMAA